MSGHFSPRSVTIVEANPETIVGYVVTIRRDSDNELLNTGSEIPSDPSGTTVIPVGTLNLIGLEGEVIQIDVTEQAAPGHGNNPVAQRVPGGPFTVTALADGSESLTVLI